MGVRLFSECEFLLRLSPRQQHLRFYFSQEFLQQPIDRIQINKLNRNHRLIVTFSFVVIWRASLTFPNVPSPMDLPRMYWPTLRSFGSNFTSAAFFFYSTRIAFASLTVLLTATVDSRGGLFVYEERA